MLFAVMRGIRRASLRTQQATRRLSADLDRALGAVRTIRASQAEQRESTRLGDEARRIYSASFSMDKPDVPRRGCVALIGLSGAGKSTLFALIERFYEPSDGEVLFCGRDAREFDRHAYGSRIGSSSSTCRCCTARCATT